MTTTIETKGFRATHEIRITDILGETSSIPVMLIRQSDGSARGYSQWEWDGGGGGDWVVTPRGDVRERVLVADRNRSGVLVPVIRSPSAAKVELRLLAEAQ